MTDLFAIGLSYLIRGYQYLISPVLPPSCRFVPSCSEYARQTLLSRGVVRGLWLAGRRLLRCHPFCEGGYDPPPGRTDRASAG